MSETSERPTRRLNPKAAVGLLRRRSLVVCWVALLGIALAGAALLSLIGPPAPNSTSGSAAAVGQTAPPAVRTEPAHARQPSSTAFASVNKSPSGEISSLLTRAESQIAKGRDEFPPGDNAVETLQLIADAMPKASPLDRQRVSDMASRLYDRAKAALDAGNLDEEQRLLALGSILAPPPDIAPKTADAGEPAPGPDESSAPGSPAAAASETQASSRPGSSIHFPAGSASAEADAKQLAARLGQSFEVKAAGSDSEVLRTAIIRYSDETGHAAARDVGKILGEMRYSWRIERRSTDNPIPPQGSVEIWMPTR
jgi:hypothetical protein